MTARTSDFLILIFFLAVYLFFAGNFIFDFPVTKYNYFNYLGEAFLHGKLNLISVPLDFTDLIIYQQKLFLYWPPGPALTIMPLIFLWGLKTSDIFYTAIAGALNCLVFLLFLKEIQKSKIINLNFQGRILAVIFFSLGTVHFYLSLFGRVWFTEQIFALLFFLTACWQIFKYINKTKTSNLLLPAVFFSLAVYSRNTYFLSLPFFLTMIYLKTPLKKSRIFLKKVFLFFLIFFFFSILNLYYNYFRFSSFLNNGVAYHLKNKFFEGDYSRHGFFSLYYLPINIYYNFLNPLALKPQFPFIRPDPMGNGLFFVSPLFVYLFFISKKLFRTKKTKLFNLGIIISIPLMLSPSLFLFGTGWFQFGHRYLLDIIPFLIILVIQATNNFKSRLSQFLLILSCFINIMGFFWWKGLNI